MIYCLKGDPVWGHLGKIFSFCASSSYFCLSPCHSSPSSEELRRIHRDSRHCGRNLPAFWSDLQYSEAEVRGMRAHILALIVGERLWMHGLNLVCCCQAVAMGQWINNLRTYLRETLFVGFTKQTVLFAFTLHFFNAGNLTYIIFHINLMNPPVCTWGSRSRSNIDFKKAHILCFQSYVYQIQSLFLKI